MPVLCLQLVYVSMDIVINKAEQIVKTRGQYINNTWSGVNTILNPDTTVSWLPINLKFNAIPIIQICSKKNMRW